LKIKRFVCGNLEANGYIAWSEGSSDAWVIDPGYSHEKYCAFLGDEGLKAAGILLTHSHSDHSGSAERLKNELGCQVFMHRLEAPFYSKGWDVLLEGGEMLKLGDDSLEAIHTPGHSAGGLCFYSEKSQLAFTGDTVFNVDLGRTDFPGGSEEQMRRSIREVVDSWGNGVTIYPGHGDSCTMAYVRKINEEFNDMLKG